MKIIRLCSGIVSLAVATIAIAYTLFAENVNADNSVIINLLALLCIMVSLQTFVKENERS